ncbi:MAG TPA: glycosyltransferase family 39 protein [Rhodocyclaceae bacterium]|nr:glycosyltransferase family 39 protein [Rhodocyclaceae bacterium]HUY02643.1 glycosyltransferase family 39 protein [Rhodocyclaceae bacterium]
MKSCNMPSDASVVTKSHRAHSVYVGQYYWYLAILVAVASAVLSFSWIGFIASDDGYYLQSGLGWLDSFPYVAGHFGTARATVGIPIAIAMGLVGKNEFSVVLPTCLYWLGTLSITYIALAKRFSFGFALITSLAIATVPLFALMATIPSADVPELFFCATSFWLFATSCEQVDRLSSLFGAGAMAALAFITHETAVALVIFYGILFLLGFAMPRRHYWMMALGFSVIWGMEMLYYGLLTGDAFYRYHLSMVGVAIHDRIVVPPFHFDDSGNLHIAKWIDPIVMLLTKHEFSLAFYFVIPAAIWALRPLRIPTESWDPANREKSLAWLLALAGAICLLFAMFALQGLKLLARYYMISTYFFLIATAIWVKIILFYKRPKFTIILIGAVIGVNFLCILADNKNPRFSERELVNYLSRSTGPVYTDPYTAHLTEQYCKWSGQDCSRIIGAPPRKNVAFYFNPKSATSPNRFMSPNDVVLYSPKPEWIAIWRPDPEPSVLSSVVLALGLAPLLPVTVLKKLITPNPLVVVYRSR